MSRQLGLVNVAVGIVIDSNRKILIAERPCDKIKAGFWEFPGGKVENGETVFEALKREFQEEVGIVVNSALPFMDICYEKQETKVLLNTWIIKDYEGYPVGKENQVIQWIDVMQLDDFIFLEANKTIIEKLKTCISII
jgi:8-oxo-dGTP diphosphatase